MNRSHPGSRRPKKPFVRRCRCHFAGNPTCKSPARPSNGLEAYQRVCELQPDLTLMDSVMPASGIEAAAMYRVALPSAKI